MRKIYLGSIALEKNRFNEGKIPSYLVSDYIEKAKNDGFDGIELWENHYLLADNAEKKRLVDSDMDFIFNSYFSLAYGITDDIIKVADAINALNASAVKFNFSNKKLVNSTSDIQRQIDTLLSFGEKISPNVRILCECHEGTIADEPEIAAQIFDKLDARFGAIIHLIPTYEFAKKCFDCYGERICHIHSAYPVEIGVYKALDEANGLMEKNFKYYLKRGFNGTVTVEFAKNAYSPEDYYINSLRDLEYLRNID